MNISSRGPRRVRTVMPAVIRRRIAFIVVSIAAFAFSASAQATGKRPVIIIPGITGSDLVDQSTGKHVWFSIKRAKSDDLRLPMTSPVLSRNRDGLKPVDIIRSVELPVLPDVEVYKSVLDALKEKGYAEATWDSPKAADVFYVFPYDWRRDNVENAQLLMRRMTSVKTKLRQRDLKFDILAHSMGGLIARYAAMYGSADLPMRGTPVPSWAGAAHINKLMMFGTPNEGSFSSFEGLLKGYPIVADRKLPLVDDLRAEDIMTVPSVYQLMPHRRSARFLDSNLKPMNVDLYDVNNWIKYGWGAIADPKFLSKLRDAERLALTNKEIKPAKRDKDEGLDDSLVRRLTYAQVKAFMASALRRAKFFHQAIDAPVKSFPIQLFAYGGNCSPTIDAVVLIHDDKKNEWVTLLEAKEIKNGGEKAFTKDEVKAVIFAKGDGRVTTRSLLTGSPDGPEPETPLLNISEPVFGCGTHTKLFLDKPIQDSFLSTLVVESGKQL